MLIRISSLGARNVNFNRPERSRPTRSDARHLLGQREQRLVLLRRPDEPPKVHNAVANDDVA